MTRRAGRAMDRLMQQPLSVWSVIRPLVLALALLSFSTLVPFGTLRPLLMFNVT